MSIIIPPEIQAHIATAVTWLWSSYGKQIAEKAADRIWDEAKWCFGIERYYTSLYEKVGFVRILGRMEAEPLENIFTHVNVLDRPTADRRYNIQQLMTEFAPRDFEKWENIKRIAGEEAVAKYSKLFILGKPGAGKTTFLKHTALRAINREIKKVPIFVTLKELSDSGKEITDFMAHQLTIHRLPEPKAFLQRILENGDALVLFDGLDEVNLADDQRSRMIQQLNDFVYQYSDCPILLTCRVAATDYSFTQFEYVEMADFDKGQIGRYIDQWFARDEVKRRNCRRALLEDQDNQAVHELAQVPLLLALLCLVFEERNEIPPERHEIYAEAIQALLSTWDARRNINRDTVYSQLSLDRKQKMLAVVAATTFEKGDYFLKENEVVKLLADYLQGVPGLEDPDAALVLQTMEAQHGIFVERAKSIHSFSHLTVQEYFTARYIVDNRHDGTVTRLMTHVGDDRWREVFLLVASMLNDATEFGMGYLMAAHKLIVADMNLVNIVKWTEYKRTQHPTVRCRAGVLRALMPALALDRVHDLTHARGIALARGRTLARVLARDLDLDRVLALARDLDLDRARALDRDHALDLALTVSRAYSLESMTAELEQLVVLDKDDNAEVKLVFTQELITILDRYETQWNPRKRFQITDADVAQFTSLTNTQVKKLQVYLEALNLLVHCLQIAYVPQRGVLLDKFLLPPEQW